MSCTTARLAALARPTCNSSMGAFTSSTTVGSAATAPSVMTTTWLSRSGNNQVAGQRKRGIQIGAATRQRKSQRGGLPARANPHHRSLRTIEPRCRAPSRWRHRHHAKSSMRCTASDLRGSEALLASVGIDGGHTGRTIEQDDQMPRLGALRKPAQASATAGRASASPSAPTASSCKAARATKSAAGGSARHRSARRDHLPETQGRHRFLHRRGVPHMEEDDQRNADQRQQTKRRQELQTAHPTTPRCESKPSTTVSNGQSVCRVMSGICSDGADGFDIRLPGAHGTVVVVERRLRWA